MGDACVVFLETPILGGRCLVEMDGRVGCTHKLVRVHQDSGRPSFFRVETETGAFCAGEAVLSPRSRLLYEMLYSISRYGIDQRFHEVWTPLVGSVEQTIHSFVDQKLVREADLASKMERKYRASKTIAGQHGAPVGGPKRKIIDGILSRIPADAAEALVSDLLAYELTQSGRALTDRYLSLKAREREMMEAAAVSQLEKGAVGTAGAVVARYEAAQVFPRGLGCDWANGMAESVLQTASLLLQYTYDDLGLDAASRRKVAVQMALAELLGLGPRELRGPIKEATGSDHLPCDALQQYLRSAPSCEYVHGRSWDSTDDLVEVYCNTYQVRAANQAELEQLRVEHTGKGVLVDCIDDCPECRRGKHTFRWSEMHMLPVLPRHWGCRCLYAAWL